MAKPTSFSRAWRWRFSTRLAAKQRRILKRNRNRYNRRQVKRNSDWVDVRLDDWQVI